MHKVFASFLALAVFCKSTFVENNLSYQNKNNDYEKMSMTGDLIFQTSFGRSQAHAIQVATLSPYNHVGIISVENDGIFVYEASSRVTKVKIEKFIHRQDTKSRFVVYRHKNINDKNSKKVISYAKKTLGKKYDTYLSWTDDKFYCSELAYKAYKHAGLGLEQPKKIKEMKFGLLISKIIPNGYERKKFNLNDSVVAPSHLSRDNNLVRVFQNWI